MTIKKDLTGMRTGRLVVIRFSHRNKRGVGMWLCRCDCGNTTILRSDHITCHRVKSCGCWQKEIEEKGLCHRSQDGESRTRLYSIWYGMKKRCRDSKLERYGGRGISVCKEWDESYKAFRDWSLANGYTEHLSIDRIDNDGNYEPSNCRWTTAKEQAWNRENGIVLHYRGAELQTRDVVAMTGLKYKTVWQRYKNGWTDREIIETPFNCRRGTNMAPIRLPKEEAANVT